MLRHGHFYTKGGEPPFAAGAFTFVVALRRFNLENWPQNFAFLFLFFFLHFCEQKEKQKPKRKFETPRGRKERPEPWV